MLQRDAEHNRLRIKRDRAGAFIETGQRARLVPTLADAEALRAEPPSRWRKLQRALRPMALGFKSDEIRRALMTAE